MRILLMVKRFQFGGAENHVCELANALTAEGHNVWLLTGTGFQKCRLHPAIQHHVVRFSDLKLIFHLWYLVRLIRKERIEVIHAHQRFPIFLGTLAAKLCKIPIVATVHGSPVTDLKTEFVRNRVDRVIAIRQSCYDRLKESPVLESKVVLIPNGINLPVKHVDRKTASHCFSLFYISRLDKHHAQLLRFFLKEVWPEMIRRYPDSILHIVGDGTGFKQIKQFWRGSKFKPYRETVRLDGYCANVADLFQHADLVMGAGRVAIESLVNGVPLLSLKYNHLGPVTDRANLKKMQYANFVDLDASPPDQNEMLSTLTDFIVRREYFENEAKELQLKMRLEYDLDQIVKGICGVYKEVI